MFYASIFVLALAAVACWVLWRDRRAAAARREIDRRLEATARRLDQRADHLQGQLDRLLRLQRIDHLARLVDDGVTEGLLDDPVAPRLRDALRELHAEAGQRPEA